VIRIVNVRKNFYTRSRKHTVEALKGVSLDVPEGETFGIIGRSGSGKSTLVRCMNFLETPSAGECWFNGQNLATLSEKELRLVRRQMGMIFQGFHLLSSKTVFENVAFPLKIEGLSKRVIAERVDELLEVTGLDDKRNMYPSELSGGQKQRVAIARALAPRPKVLLCDEATSALDPETTDSILTLIQDVQARYGLTVVLITHELDAARRICHRVAVMNEGEIVETGSVLQVFGEPKHPATLALVRSSLHVELPDYLAQHLQSESAPTAVLRFLFSGNDALSYITQTLPQGGYSLQVVQGRVENANGVPFGLMLCTLGDNTPEQLSNVLASCHEKKIQPEVLGYVS
jgi:D-methionine transport system ATP-binding protein